MEYMEVIHGSHSSWDSNSSGICLFWTPFFEDCSGIAPEFEFFHMKDSCCPLFLIVQDSS